MGLFFDPNDERESYKHQVIERQLAIPSNQTIGHVRSRDEETRRTHDNKRTKKMVAAVLCFRRHTDGYQRKLEDFEDYNIYSALKTLCKDGRCITGLRSTDVQIPNNYRQALRLNHARFWREAMATEMAALRTKEVLRQIPRSEMPAGQRTINTI